MLTLMLTLSQILTISNLTSHTVPGNLPQKELLLIVASNC